MFCATKGSFDYRYYVLLPLLALLPTLGSKRPGNTSTRTRFRSIGFAVLSEENLLFATAKMQFLGNCNSCSNISIGLYLVSVCERQHSCFEHGSNAARPGITYLPTNRGHGWTVFWRHARHRHGHIELIWLHFKVASNLIFFLHKLSLEHGF